MPLHPQVQAHLARLSELNFGALQDASPERAREGARRLTAASVVERQAVEAVVDLVADTVLGDVPIRLYRPSSEARLPVIVFFHGGGYVIGDLESHDALLRSLVNATGMAVVSVDYPLAPEAKFPTQIQTGFAATSWVAAHAERLGVDAARLIVAGDSAGGNLATVVALQARDAGSPEIAYQLLIYPDLDFRRENETIRQLAGRYGNISREAQFWFMGHYLHSDAQRTDPRVSPILEPDLSGLPPAYILTAEYDALRDEGEQYGQRLREAGVPVTVRRHDGMIHEFLRHPFDDSATAIAEIAQALRGV